MTQLSKYQKFETQRLHRLQLKAAPYNPRSLDAYARAKLERSLKKTGLVQPLIWNRQTGNLVGGHQRLAILDSLEGSPDYELDTAVVDLDPKREKELNVFLNNQNAMGYFDTEKLAEIVKEPDIQLENLGFDINELKLILPPEEAPALTPEYQPDSPSERTVDEINHIKDLRRDWKQESRVESSDASTFYAIAVFKTSVERDEFMTKIDMPTGATYFDGARLRTLIGY